MGLISYICGNFMRSSMRKIAVIDLGTNTFHILVAHTNEDSVNILYREKVAVKIGEGGISAQTIVDEARTRAIATLKHFKEIADSHGVTEIHATATSAFRNAANKKEVVDDIFTETGIEIQVISGEEEAELIYRGVKKALRLHSEKSLIMDIGGGSVEFIIADDKRSYFKQSFEIGAQRLLDLFQHTDPMLPEDIMLLEDYLHEKLQPLGKAVQELKPVTLIGSSGSFDTLSDIYCQANNISRPADATEYPLTLESFFQIFNNILNKDRNERLQIPGMIPLRVDMIVVACCLIRYVLKQYNINQIRVSSYSLKEGLLYCIIQKQPIDNL